MDSSSTTPSAPGWKTRLGSFYVQSKRVWHLLRKPTGEEFKAVAKISALGLLVIGFVGFVVADIIKLLS